MRVKAIGDHMLVPFEKSTLCMNVGDDEVTFVLGYTHLLIEGSDEKSRCDQR